jgi:hypothetical protein
MSKLQKKPSGLKRGHPTSKQELLKKNFYFCGSFLASLIRIRIRIPNPDPDPLARLNTNPIRIRIRNPAFLPCGYTCTQVYKNWPFRLTLLWCDYLFFNETALLYIALQILILLPFFRFLTCNNNLAQHVDSRTSLIWLAACLASMGPTPSSPSPAASRSWLS